MLRQTIKVPVLIPDADAGLRVHNADLGRTIRRLRGERDLTIEGLALNAGMHPTYLSGIGVDGATRRGTSSPISPKRWRFPSQRSSSTPRNAARKRRSASPRPTPTVRCGPCTLITDKRVLKYRRGLSLLGVEIACLCRGDSFEFPPQGHSPTPTI